MIIESVELPISDVTTTKVPEDYLQTRNLLYNLCLTCKWVCMRARPLLYRTVIFSLDHRLGDEMQIQRNRSHRDIQALVLLIRTLLEKPEIRGLVKNILCPSELFPDPWWCWKENIVEAAEWPFAAYDYPTWDKCSMRDMVIFKYAHLYPWFTRIKSEWTLGQRLIAVLLWYTPNLELLLLHSAIEAPNNPSNSYTELSKIMGEISDLLNEPPLPNLSALYIQRHILFKQNSRVTDLVIEPAFLGRLNLTRLHFWRNIRYLTFDDFTFSIVRLKELKFVGASK